MNYALTSLYEVAKQSIYHRIARYTNVNRAVVIGAGIAGLSSAALLARAGMDVTLLEAQSYPGGCAGTYFHQGYRFDAGATLAGGFFPGGPMDILRKVAGIATWPVRKTEHAMTVHLPDNIKVDRRGDEHRWDAYESAFGKKALNFWRWQEATADELWDFALRLPPWPPQTIGDFTELAAKGMSWMLNDRLSGSRIGLGSFAMDAFKSVKDHLRDMPESLRLFVDGQLLISAQTTSNYTNALYGAAALDLPRKGVAHLEGGMGKIADILVQAIRANNGQVLFRHEVSRIHFAKKRAVAVETRRGEIFDADIVVANLTPWNIAKITNADIPPRLRNISAYPPKYWGAFVIYAGIDESVIPRDFSLHHQILKTRPLGEGNSLFLSLSPDWDTSRAPTGKRALTISTHTDLTKWWRIIKQDPADYKKSRDEFADSILDATEEVIPGIRDAASLVLPGTPVTFQRFTGREMGWVGGFQQTSLTQNWGPRLGSNLWMVGDSIFPGQSVAAVALGGLRVGGTILREAHQTIPSPLYSQGTLT